MRSRLIWIARPLSALAVAVLLASATPFLRSLPAQAFAGAVTYARLGPADGWRCLTPTTYRYDPRTEVPDSRLVAERPEAAAVAAFRGGSFTSEQVAITLGADRAVVHGILLTRAGQAWRRVVVLHAMQAQPMAVDLPWQSISTCDAHLRAWLVVAI